MSQLPTIAFIGLGIMGKPMAGHLLKAGYPVIACNRSPQAVADLVSQGAQAADTPAQAAQSADLIITMLPDSPDVELVALGDKGIIEGAKEGALYADMSSIAPSTARKVAEELGAKGVRCLDAPVSGGQLGAQQATLSIMVGGSEADFEAFKPVFEVLGQTITLCGPSGAGQTVKACNQIQVAMNFAGMAEAFVLGAKAGVDPAIILKVLSGGYAQTKVMDVRGPKIIQGDFEPGFKSAFHFKDLNIIMKTATDFGVPLPVTSVIHSLYNAMVSLGRGDLDHSGLITIIEDLAGVEARTKG